MKTYGNNAEKIAEGIQDVSPPDSTTTAITELRNLPHDQTLDKKGDLIINAKFENLFM